MTYEFLVRCWQSEAEAQIMEVLFRLLGKKTSEFLFMIFGFHVGVQRTMEYSFEIEGEGRPKSWNFTVTSWSSLPG